MILDKIRKDQRGKRWDKRRQKNLLGKKVFLVSIARDHRFSASYLLCEGSGLSNRS